MSLGNGPAPRPTRSYDEALVRLASLRALDGPDVSVQGATQFFGHGHRTPIAVVLLHGLTNAPQQWALFARAASERGATVVVPRLPGHGMRDRATRRIASVSATDLLRTTGDAVDIACGAGERVVLAGLSIGGSIAIWTALERADVDRAVAIVPLFGIARLGERGSRTVATLLGALPNAFVPWSPGGDRGQTPSYAYPKFPTHLLAETLRIGLDVVARTRAGATIAGDARFVLNAREPACDNGLSRAVATSLARTASGAVETIVLHDLPANHDVIDPDNANARVDRVYPSVLAAIGL